MARIEQSIDVNVPVSTAYNQWTQFEEFPRFMEGIERVEQRDDTHLHWVAEVGGHREEWDAEITEQHPDHRVAWTATSGKGNAGGVFLMRGRTGGLTTSGSKLYTQDTSKIGDTSEANDYFGGT